MNLDFQIRSRRRFDENGEAVCKVLFRHEKGNSSTQSNPNNSQTVTDQRVASSEGSIAATQGSSVTVNDVSSEVIAQNNEALMKVADSNAKLAGEAIAGIGNVAKDVTYTAVSGNVDVSKAAIQNAGNNLADSLAFGRDIYEESTSLSRDANANVLDAQKAALGFAQTAQLSANDLVQRTNESFTAKLASNAGIAPTSAADNMVKYVTIAAAVIGLGIAFAQRKKA